MIRLADLFRGSGSLSTALETLITSFPLFCFKIVESTGEHCFILVHIFLGVELLNYLLNKFDGLRVIQLCVDFQPSNHENLAEILGLALRILSSKQVFTINLL